MRMDNNCEHRDARNVRKGTAGYTSFRFFEGDTEHGIQDLRDFCEAKDAAAVMGRRVFPHGAMKDARRTSDIDDSPALTLWLLPCQVEEDNAELEMVIYSFHKSGKDGTDRGSCPVKCAAVSREPYLRRERDSSPTRDVVSEDDIENGETVDEWYPVKLNQGLRLTAPALPSLALFVMLTLTLKNGRGPEDPLLHVQLTVAQFRYNRRRVGGRRGR
ncbi:hypothetical protein GUITHDRAFT_138391 [Guillardia theta CCMP2712]|uniref:Uncharacterized protein n=1 Tax=Guillardia theta (strain CCMP2712) TaxID=905079 RepID=L1JCP9_GUITC|nr:hypothetical protein GUITHDRAFT_138391 [Guillardia theta CCMP2712]EKX46298.1 hypothetical protein GUITHDRAFT_138391 [Guillardia theta CCMP2712]|eukprot:XP_005833278.1 hypothetical protein GUITHDRAFT_138391 [Guillardia theta CCMP2712]